MPMEYRRFGNTGLKVSALGYGCMTFGDPSNGNVSSASCVRPSAAPCASPHAAPPAAA